MKIYLHDIKIIFTYDPYEYSMHSTQGRKYFDISFVQNNLRPISRKTNSTIKKLIFEAIVTSVQRYYPKA